MLATETHQRDYQEECQLEWLVPIGNLPLDSLFRRFIKAASDLFVKQIVALPFFARHGQVPPGFGTSHAQLAIAVVADRPWKELQHLYLSSRVLFFIPNALEDISQNIHDGL